LSVEECLGLIEQNKELLREKKAEREEKDVKHLKKLLEVIQIKFKDDYIDL